MTAPLKQGLYDPRFEHDSCGLGFVVDVEGRRSRRIVDQAIEVLLNLEHRGACGCEPNTGDGAGILLQISHEFFARECAHRKFSLPAAGDYVRLAVSDTGRRTSETAGSRVFPGGYGLATVHDIVTRNGGAVSVTSGPGAGSTFEVYLPRLDNAVLERPLMPDVDPHHGSETVLVVENEEPVREMIVDVLSLHGYTALAAADGEEALRVAASPRGALDLIIVDVVMPGISGEALAQRLTAGRPGTRVLYISGYTDDLIRQHGFTLASGHFLQKPFSVDDLARKVREVLRGRVA